jgi:hypothetical protein
MRSLRNLLVTSFLCLGLVSCAVMSSKECQFADWQQLGLTDGMAGKSLALFNERRSDCAEASIKADTKAYLRGRELGLKTYCQVQNAAQVGLRGEPYEGVCPAGIDREFRRRYQIGFDIHRFHDEIAQLENHYNSLEYRFNHNQMEFERRLADSRKNSGHLGLYREFDYEQRRIRGEQGAIQTKLQWTHDQLRNAEGALAQLR